MRPPSVLSVTLVDGEALVEALPVAPWVDCAAVARHLITTRLRLTDARRSTFGLFFADNGRPLNRSEFVGDVQESAFVFKRVLRFLHEPSRSDDMVFERLNFLHGERAFHLLSRQRQRRELDNHRERDDGESVRVRHADGVESSVDKFEHTFENIRERSDEKPALFFRDFSGGIHRDGRRGVCQGGEDVY